MRIGVIVFAACMILPFAILLARFPIPTEIAMILVFVFLVIGILTAFLIAYYVIGSSMLFRGTDVLWHIAPPAPFIEGRLAVLDKAPVYVIAQWGSNALLFVALFQPERAFEQKIKLPRAIWTWEYTYLIGDIKVARRESTFTLPVDEGTYCTGNGILYSLLLERGAGIFAFPKTITAEQLNLIVDSLAREVGSHGSGENFDFDNFK